MGSNEVRGGKRPDLDSVGAADVVEFCEMGCSGELVLLLVGSGTGKRLLSKVPMGSKMPPPVLLVVVLSDTVLLPTGGSTEVTPVGSLLGDDETMPVGPMTIPDSVDDLVRVPDFFFDSVFFVVGRTVTLGKPDPEDGPPTTTVLSTITVVTGGFGFSEVLDFGGHSVPRISEIRSLKRSRFVVDGSVVVVTSGVDDDDSGLVMVELWYSRLISRGK